MKWAMWVLAAIGGCSLIQALVLLTTPVDGGGIGLYVLGYEITDRLPNDQIPGTAATFATVGAIFLVIAATLYLIPVVVHRRKRR